MKVLSCHVDNIRVLIQDSSAKLEKAKADNNAAVAALNEAQRVSVNAKIAGDVLAKAFLNGDELGDAYLKSASREIQAALNWVEPAPVKPADPVPVDPVVPE
jgi:hypothetical protein